MRADARWAEGKQSTGALTSDLAPPDMWDGGARVVVPMLDGLTTIE